MICPSYVCLIIVTGKTTTSDYTNSEHFLLYSLILMLINIKNTYIQLRGAQTKDNFDIHISILNRDWIWFGWFVNYDSDHLTTFQFESFRSESSLVNCSTESNRAFFWQQSFGQIKDVRREVERKQNRWPFDKSQISVSLKIQLGKLLEKNVQHKTLNDNKTKKFPFGGKNTNSTSFFVCNVFLLVCLKKRIFPFQVVN